MSSLQLIGDQKHHGHSHDEPNSHEGSSKPLLASKQKTKRKLEFDETSIDLQIDDKRNDTNIQITVRETVCSGRFFLPIVVGIACLFCDYRFRFLSFLALFPILLWWWWWQEYCSHHKFNGG
jgi:hypothetical protein